MKVKKQQLKLDMEQQTGSKSRKECAKAVYCHPVNLTYMQSTSCETLSWKNHRLESRLLGKIPTASDNADATVMPESKELQRLSLA